MADPGERVCLAEEGRWEEAAPAEAQLEPKDGWEQAGGCRGAGGGCEGRRASLWELHVRNCGVVWRLGSPRTHQSVLLWLGGSGLQPF